MFINTPTKKINNCCSIWEFWSRLYWKSYKLLGKIIMLKSHWMLA